LSQADSDRSEPNLMQGTLKEIDIRSILHLIELGQKTGQLVVLADPLAEVNLRESAISPSKFPPPGVAAAHTWFVFFQSGRIVYATETANLSRIKDYLRRCHTDLALTRLFATDTELDVSEYSYLWILLSRQILTPAQSRSILQGMVNETLFDLFNLEQGRFIFASDLALAPQLTTLPITPYLARTIRQVQQWKQLYPYIHSPEQCPEIIDTANLQGFLSNRTFNKFSGFADGATSIRQMARYLHRDILTIARAIYPYVQQGAIRLPQRQPRSEHSQRANYSPTEPRTQTPTLVCIDDQEHSREQVQSMLSSAGYRVTAIANPIDAISQILQLKPALILCKAEMPDLNGYEICAMLRQIRTFRQTPIIIMISDGHQMLNQVLTRTMGATSCLKQPFGESELLPLLKKYVRQGNSDKSCSLPGMANPPDDGLQIEGTDVSSLSSTPLN
jgi:twitching motility two-component system response regulator PilG